MGGRRARGLKARVRQERCISRGEGRWAKLHSGSIQAGGLQRGRHSVG